MNEVRLPILLNSELGEIKRFEPSALQIQLNLTPPSTADMTLASTETIPIHSWMRLYTIHGDAGIFRVATSDIDYESEEQRITLEHGICVLNDCIIPELEDDDDNEIEKTVPNMLSWLLGFQTQKIADTGYWTLRRCDTTNTIFLTRSGETVYDMLMEMMDQLPDYELSLDQSSFPWEISIVAKETTVSAEGRLSRNISSARVTYDDEDMCTRVYANGLTGGYMDADTISTYGIIENSLILNTETELEEAVNIATRYLEKRKHPAIAVEINGIDLSQTTGETIDAFTLGKLFRLTIPEYNITVNQTITGVLYQNVYGAPESVIITLANRISDLAQRTAKQKKTSETNSRSSSRAAGGIANNAAAIAENRVELSVHDEYITAIEDGIEVWRTDDASLTIKNALVKLFTRQRDLYGTLGNKDGIVSALRQAGINVDASKSLVEIFASEQIARKSVTDTNSTDIATNSAAIQVNAGNIALKVSQTDYNGNTIASLINQTATTILIRASRIDLDGYVTTSTLASNISDLNYVTMGNAGVSNLTILGSITGGSSYTFFGRPAIWKSIDVLTNVTRTLDKYDACTLEGTNGVAYYFGGIVRDVTLKKTTETIHYWGYS